MKLGHFLNLLREGTHYYIYSNGILSYEGDINSKANYENHEVWEDDYYGDRYIVETRSWNGDYNCIEISI